MKVTNITWRIGGEAGYGILTSGNIFSRSFSKKGYFVIDNIEYPSLIRGGHNTFSSRISCEPIYSVNHDINILAALNHETIGLHQEEVAYGGHIIYEGETGKQEKSNNIRKDIKYIPVPFRRIISEQGLPQVTINNIAIGASMALMSHDLQAVRDAITEAFREKEAKVTISNLKALELGYKYVREKLGIKAYELEIVKPAPRLLLTGNDAVFLAGVRSGCKFYAAYPMTPASSILHSFAAAEEGYNIVVKHAEDEIAVINMAIGASFAGARAMAATSGGGFSLMAESLGSSAMTETPLVLVLCQRPAPATGLPTWTEQGDMLFSLFASQGEFLRVVLAPGDPEECFNITGKAFNIAEKYQIPVIILLDKYLSESHFTCGSLDPRKIKTERKNLITSDSRIPDGYLRYKDTSDGVSPRPVLGLKKGVHIANSDEHDEYGFTAEDGHNRRMMTDKRFRKIGSLMTEIPPPRKYGPASADITLWSWGSCKGPVLEAMKILNHKEKRINLIHFNHLYPFEHEMTEKYLEEANMNVVIENNKTSQLSKLIAMNTGHRIMNKILKYSGRQFLPEEIINSIEKI
jgi:2-oxoglutarate/2-oxoacid ferredoxin oxidoreductase subunit alpha